MSRNACNDLNEILPVQRNIEFAANRIIEDETADNYGDNRQSAWYVGFTGWLNDKFLGKESMASIDEQRKYLYKQYKSKEGERYLLVAQIQAMLQSNPNIIPFFWKSVQSDMNLLDFKKMREDFPEFEMKTFKNPDGELVPDLQTFPPQFVRVVHSDLYHWINGGKYLAKTSGFIHNLQVELLTPKTVSQKDPSGLIAKMNSNLEIWNGAAQAQASQFYEPSADGSRPGLHQINADIKNLANSFGNMPEDVAWDIFFKWKRGQAFFRKGDNTLYISKPDKWVQPEFEGQHRWIKTEDASMPYTWQNKQKNEFTVKFSTNRANAFNKSQYELLGEASEKLTKWYDAVYETAKSISKAQSARRIKIGKIAEENGTEKLLEEITNFAIFSENVDIQGMTDIDKKEKFYMTRMYYQDQIPRLMQEALDGESGMLNKRDILLSKINEWDPTAEHSQDEITSHKNNIKRMHNLNADIFVLENKILTFDEGLFDPHHQEYIQAQSVMKNFKRVTEMIHPNNARTDSGVLSQYVDGLFRTVSRNNVSLDLMEAMAVSGNEATPGIVDYAINHYKSSFYFPDAKTSFFSMKSDAQTWANRINATGIANVSAIQLQNAAKNVSSFFIFNALNGLLQGLTNYSALMLKIHEGGVFKMTRIMSEFDKDPQYWRSLAASSGVTQFTNFIEGHVQRGLTDAELAASQGEIDILISEIKQMEKTGNFKKLMRYDKKIKKLKDQKLASKLSAAAQWAITRRIYYKENENKFMKAIKVSAGKIYSKFPSISETEEELRTLSFMIGVTNFTDAHPGISSNDPKAIAAGVEYTQRTDFGLSHQHVGLAFRGPLGGFLTRMRTWHVQRFGHDIKVYQKAFREQLRPEMVVQNKEGNFEIDEDWMSRVGNRGVGMYKLFKGIVTPGVVKGGVIGGAGAAAAGLNPALVGVAGAAVGGVSSNYSQKQRLDQAFTAKARSHFWTHMVASAVMDFGVYALAPPGYGSAGAVVSKVIRTGFYRSPMGRGLNGFGSSYHSLIMGSMHLLGIMATGGFDEQKFTPEQFFSKYAFHLPFLGLGASVILDLTLHLAHNHRLDQIKGDYKRQQNHLRKAGNLLIPGGKVVGNTKEFLEDTGVLNKKKEILESNY